MQDDDIEIDDDDEGWYVCTGCGTAISRLEVGGEFDGRFADYDMRMQGMANFVYCGECWEQIKQNMQTPIKVAKRRRLKLIEDLKLIEHVNFKDPYSSGVNRSD